MNQRFSSSRAISNKLGEVQESFFWDQDAGNRP
jgi:hypothetical protein